MGAGSPSVLLEAKSSGDGNEPRLGEFEAFQREPWALEPAEDLPGVSHWSFGSV